MCQFTEVFYTGNLPCKCSLRWGFVRFLFFWMYHVFKTTPKGVFILWINFRFILITFFSVQFILECSFALQEQERNCWKFVRNVNQITREFTYLDKNDVWLGCRPCFFCSVSINYAFYMALWRQCYCPRQWKSFSLWNITFSSIQTLSVVYWAPK